MSILLTSFLLFQYAGWLLFWQIAAVQVRHLARHESEKTQVQTRLQIPVSLFNSLKGEREFRYQGHLYDIVRTMPASGDSIALIVYRDHAEESLFHHLGEYFFSKSADMSGDSPVFLHWLKILFSPFLLVEKPVLPVFWRSVPPLLANAASHPAQWIAALFDPPPRADQVYP